MQNSKLIRLLRTFSKKEWKEFDKFCNSTYFNEGRNYDKLIHEIKKYYPGFFSKELTRENIYRMLYPGKKYKETVMFTITSGLYKLALDFIIYKNMNSMKTLKSAILIKETSMRQLNEEAGNRIESITSAIIKSSSRNFSDLALVYEEVLNHYYNTNDKYNIGIYRNEYTKFLLYSTIEKLLTSQLEFITNKLYSKNVSDEVYLLNLISGINMERILEQIRRSDNDNYSKIAVLYYALMARKEPDNDEHYFTLKLLSEKYFDKFDKDSNTRNYWNLSSICSSRINNGKTEFNDELFGIYEKILEKELYVNTEGAMYFDSGLFKNIITVSLNLNKTEWTRKFINSYIGKTDPQFREHLYHYSIANLEFENGNFEDALFHCLKTEQKQLIYKVDIKNLMAKIYYETDSMESLFSLLDTYGHFIKYSVSGSKDLSTRHLNFIKFIKLITKFRMKGNNKKDILLIKNKIENTVLLNSKNWLIEKTGELVMNK